MSSHQQIPDDFLENDIIINIIAFWLKGFKNFVGVICLEDCFLLYVIETSVHPLQIALFHWYFNCQKVITTGMFAQNRSSAMCRFDAFDTPAETTNAFHNHQQGQYSHPSPPIIRSSPCLFPSKTDIGLVGQGQRSWTSYLLALVGCAVEQRAEEWCRPSDRGDRRPRASWCRVDYVSLIEQPQTLAPIILW